MKISENNLELAAEAKKTEQKLRHQILKKQDEIDSVNDFYKKRIAEVKNDGDEQYINSLKRNDQLLLGATKEYEEKLNNYNNSLIKTQKAVEREENNLKNDHFEKLKNYKNQYFDNIKEQYANASENEKIFNNLTQNNLNTISEKAHNETNHLLSTSRSKVNAINNEYNQKEMSTERNYRNHLNQNIISNQEDIRLQKAQLLKVMNEMTQKNKRLETEKIKSQTEELKYLDLHQKDLLLQKQNDFKVRYENLAKDHEAVLKDLKNHLDADVKKMNLKTISEKELISSRSDDPFYRIQTLNPKIVETENELLVQLPVAHYEKENVHLSVRDRDVKMTLTRKYSDQVKDQNGHIDKSNRNELYGKIFTAKDLLNPKLVTQKYEDGILSFKIQKL